MKKTLAIYFLGALLLFSSGCRKDDITITNQDQIFPEQENVSFQFQISDEAGLAIADVQVLLDKEVYLSDENGIVLTGKHDVPYLGLRSTFEAEGFEKLIKMVRGPAGSKTLERIVLRKSTTSIISTGDTGDLASDGGLRLPSSLMRGDGSFYQGEVIVKSIYLNPDERNFLLSAPGNLLAIDEDNNLQQLASLGMYMIELYDPDGEELNIPEGSTAIIEFPIAEKHLNLLESKIPLWYFDEESGHWIEEGAVRVQENKMIGEVSHFTWWNCDLPYDYNDMYFTFLENGEFALSGLDVRFATNDVDFGQAKTNIKGKILSRVPVDQEITFTFHVAKNELGTITVGPFSKNSENEVVHVNLGLTSISGRAYKCDGEYLSSGYAFFVLNNSLVMVEINEKGEFNYLSPKQAHSLTILDKENDKQIKLDISEEDQNSNLDLYGIVVCDENQAAFVSGNILEDTDRDNIGDIPIQNAKLEFINSQGGIYTILYTNSEGYYETVVPPDKKYTVQLSYGNQYRQIAGGDKSPDGDVYNEEFSIGNSATFRVPPGYHDTDIDIHALVAREGTISGSIMGDVDGDGIGDYPIEWVSFRNQIGPFSWKYYGVISLSDSEGSYSFKDETGFRLFSPNTYNPLTQFDTTVDWDTSPDPEGDDSLEGNNGTIPIVLQDGEEDADNNFVIDVGTTSNLACMAMEDKDMDGIGDDILTDIEFSISYRDEMEPLAIIKSELDGIARYSEDITDKTEFTLRLVTPGFEIIDIIDQSPDNDPLIIDGNLTRMEKNIERSEWDAGNIFVVRKI